MSKIYLISGLYIFDIQQSDETKQLFEHRTCTLQLKFILSFKGQKNTDV